MIISILLIGVMFDVEICKAEVKRDLFLISLISATMQDDG